MKKTASTFTRFGIAACLAWFAFCMVPDSAHADIFFDDFESYTAGSAPGAPWTSAGASVIVTNDQSLIGAGGDDQGLRLTDTSNLTGQPNTIRTFSSAATTLYVQFEYMFMEPDSLANAAFQFRGGSSIIGINFHMTHFGTDDNPAYNDGSGFDVLTGTDLNPGDWYRFTFTADALVDQFDVRIQSLANAGLDQTYTDLGFQNALAGFNEVRFLFNNTLSSADYFAVDNVRVTADANDLNFAIIPEASTVSLVFAGLMGLAFARRLKTKTFRSSV